jgi:hypothetical protein
MKKILISLFLLMCIYSVSAQVTHSISIGPELSIPIKNFGSETPTSIGGSVDYQLKFNAPFALQAHIGFNRFKGALVGTRLNFLPVRIGVVGYLYKDILFVSANAGVSFYNSPNGGLPAQTGLGFGAGGGYRQPLNNNKFIQLSGYYNLHKYKGNPYGTAIEYDFTWFNIRLAYGLSFGRSNKEKEK